MKVVSAVFAFLLSIAPAGAAHRILIEAESLELPGGWQNGGGGHGVRGFVQTGGGAAHAPSIGAIRIPSDGKWRLWVRSKDFAKDRPGVRSFTVRLGNQNSKRTFGTHAQEGMDGWEWEDGGVFDLKAGPLLVVLGEKATSFARCDALLLTDDDAFRPKGMPASLRATAAEKVALTMTPASESRPIVPPPAGAVGALAAEIANGELRYRFHRAANGIVLRAAVRNGAAWKEVESADDSYRVIARPLIADPAANAASVHPTWKTDLAPQVVVSAGGASMKTSAGAPSALWSSGEVFAVRPTNAKRIDATTVELEFAPLDCGRLTARWHMDATLPAAHVELQLAPAKPGHYSLGYHGAFAGAVDKMDFVLLPPMFHGRRIPSRPAVLLSAVTPTPIALVNQRGVSCALIAEPAELATDWPSPRNSRYAFSLRNEDGNAQPLLYSPVLGQPGSKVADTSAVRSRFLVWTKQGTWYDTYKSVIASVFNLRDYRRPVTGSLSDAAVNLFGSMRRGLGWIENGRGPMNIESRNTVTHASPLTYLSLYLLTGDREFYDRYTLPALEYMLSRSGPHFAADQPHTGNYYHDEPLGGPAAPFGATTLASAIAMTQGRTGAFTNYALKDGDVRATRLNGHAQPFEDALALWRITGDNKWREQAIQGADRYIAENFAKLPTNDVGPQPFVNVSFMPDWEGLLHMYDATGEKRFLDAAAEGARWLLTTTWVHPLIPSGDRVIHPNNEYDPARHVWWMGDKRFRLGLYEEKQFTTDGPIPLKPAKLPQMSVPGWQVSGVGLGLEQPVTYVRGGTHANIFMSIWAPNLLRLAALTGDEQFRTAARNATIGRFTNYPGYYLDGFTNWYQRPDYPEKGPDVTWLYYHHMPPFMAYVVDYLITDAEMRSRGEIRFPSMRQNGYVWFDSRLYGHAPGKIYGRTAWPWLHATAARVDNTNVDRVLAHGDGRFFVVLLNQTGEAQRTKVSFDAAALGRAVAGASLVTRIGGKPAANTALRNGEAEITVPASSFAVLELDGVDIRVATHQAAPPAKYSLDTPPATERKKIAGSKLEAVGTMLSVPPFAWRDLYVYVAANYKTCGAAKLIYRVGSGPEKQVAVDRFPCEFSVRVNDTSSPVEWRVEVPAR